MSRTTRSLALTDEGERYFEQARRLVAEIAEAESGLRQGEQQLTGWLRVAASVLPHASAAAWAASSASSMSSAVERAAWV